MVDTSLYGGRNARTVRARVDYRPLLKVVALGVLSGLAAGLMIGQALAETGIASFFGGRRHHGHLMANGQIFNQWSDSCAHRHHRFGTRLRVRWRGRSVDCVVRDRGPFIRGRIVDLSMQGARDLGIAGMGIAPVTVEVIR